LDRIEEVISFAVLIARWDRFVSTMDRPNDERNLANSSAANSDIVTVDPARVLLAAIACASSAAGCVVGFGNHDDGYLPVRTQIFGGIVGLIDLVVAFAAVLMLSGLLTF
jgi:hypothetical protein